MTCEIRYPSGCVLQDVHVYDDGRRWMTETEMQSFKKFMRASGNRVRVKRAPAGAPNPFESAIVDFAPGIPHGVLINQKKVIAMTWDSLLVEGVTDE
jgi:hypothetical protein